MLNEIEKWAWIAALCLYILVVSGVIGKYTRLYAFLRHYSLYSLTECRSAYRRNVYNARTARGLPGGKRLVALVAMMAALGYFIYATNKAGKTEYTALLFSNTG